MRGVLYAVSGLLSALPRTFGEFLAARFLSGLGIGASSMICPLYVAELVPAARRGRLGTVFQLGLGVGIFLTLFVNARIQGLGDAALKTARGWRWKLGAEAAPAVVFMTAFSGQAPALIYSSFWGSFFGFNFLVAPALARVINFATNLAALGDFAADGQSLYRYGLLMAACIVVGGWLGGAWRSGVATGWCAPCFWP